MTSFLARLVPGPVKRAFNALSLSRGTDDAASQARPPSTAPHSPGQPVAPAPPPLPDIYQDLPNLHSDGHTSDNSDDEEVIFYTYPLGSLHAHIIATVVNVDNGMNNDRRIITWPDLALLIVRFI